MRRLTTVLLSTATILSCGGTPRGPLDPSEDRILILYDAFGEPGPLTMDWGYSALVEIAGRRILFDTGNNSEIFAHNVRTLAVDLKRLDFVVISHRHGDHTDGLRHLLAVNPKVTIYTPRDLYFGGPTPRAVYQRSSEQLPPENRYFGGRLPESIPHGTPWAGARFVQIDKPTEVAPGVTLIPATSQAVGTMELAELALSVRTPQGQVIVVGCSHPGIETILSVAAAAEPDIRLVAGGLHLGAASDEAIESIARALRDKYKVRQIAPGHCSGEPAFAALRKAFGERYVYAGLGTVISLR
jgi:7,8-dihydropterin-6-yl-methyl-4-(beta-D-ribofuranosyl)aminobenzene 5'-phosphate synthase